MNFKKAFTLAETLIVMAIIGITAVLAIPNLTKSTNEKETIAKLTKIYEVADSALQNALSDYQSMSKLFKNAPGTNPNEKLINAMLPYLKIKQNYGNSPKGFSNNLFNNLDIYNKIGLIDNSTIGVYINSAGSLDNIYEGYLIVDIDGQSKGSGIEGSDTFGFLITDSGLVPLGTLTYSNIIPNFNTCLNTFGKSIGCTGWAIINKNMDYLKADSSGKCLKTGKILNWQTQPACN